MEGLKACFYSHYDPPEDIHTDLVGVVVEHNLLGCMEESETLLGGPNLGVADTCFQLGEEETGCYQDSKSHLKHVEETGSSCHGTRAHSSSLAEPLPHTLKSR